MLVSKTLNLVSKPNLSIVKSALSNSNITLKLINKIVLNKTSINSTNFDIKHKTKLSLSMILNHLIFFNFMIFFGSFFNLFPDKYNSSNQIILQIDSGSSSNKLSDNTKDFNFINL